MATSAEPKYDEMQSIQPFINKVNCTHKISIQKILTLDPDIKCNKVADDHNKMGNSSLHAKKFFNAIESFTQAIANANEGSYEISAAYAGRGAALVSIEYYKEALEDFSRALENPCSSQTSRRINKRSSKANKMLSSQREPINFETLEIPPQDKNKSIKCASNAVELRRNEVFGRHVVAARDIGIGEVLVVEKPFATIALPTQEAFHCGECLAPCLNLLPCPSCTQIMFCTKSCRKIATKKFHKYECTILKTIRKHYSKHACIALKIILRHRKILTDVNAYTTESSCYCSDRLWEVLNLCTNQRKRPFNNEMLIAYETAAVFNLMELHSDLFKDSPSELSKYIFKGLMMKLTQISITNCHDIYNVFSNNLDHNVIIGTGVYPFLSIFNHSCVPNVFRLNVGKNMILLSNAEIKKGEQLFDDYAVHYARNTKEQRQAKLWNRYFFKCACIACVDDWPNLMTLRCVDREAHDKMAAAGTYIMRNKDNKEAIRQKLAEVLEIPRDHWQEPSCEGFLFEDVIVKAYGLMEERRITIV